MRGAFHRGVTGVHRGRGQACLRRRQASERRSFAWGVTTPPWPAQSGTCDQITMGSLSTEPLFFSRLHFFLGQVAVQIFTRF